MITYLEAIREAQHHALANDPRVFIYGQDVGNFGGAFKATKGLAKEFPGRVLDSPLSEDAIIGTAIGAAIEGMRPIVEMQFADFSTCGLNQIVNHAATLYWRTNVTCPIVVRLPSGGTAGAGPFHSQSMEALYAHYPGLVVMTPATVEDAYAMLLLPSQGGLPSHRGVAYGQSPRRKARSRHDDRRLQRHGPRSARLR
jgi:acetoin:2,6-dichlorophenolindophenol oxidoreductase subunit beta